MKKRHFPRCALAAAALVIPCAGAVGTYLDASPYPRPLAAGHVVIAGRSHLFLDVPHAAEPHYVDIGLYFTQADVMATGTASVPTAPSYLL